MRKKRRICFIDDDQDELARTRMVLSLDFEVAVGRNLGDAMKSLGRKRPHMFLLDMYYGPDTKSEDRVLVNSKWQEICQKQREFYALLTSLGQSAKGGLNLANQIKQRYGGVPIVFFTRKGSLEDANDALNQGAAAVVKKPDLSTEADGRAGTKAALDSEMLRHQQELIRTLDPIIDRNRWWARHERLQGFLFGVAASLAAWAISEVIKWLL